MLLQLARDHEALPAQRRHRGALVALVGGKRPDVDAARVVAEHLSQRVEQGALAVAAAPWAIRMPS